MSKRYAATLRAGIDAARILNVEHGIANRVQFHALVLAGQNPSRPLPLRDRLHLFLVRTSQPLASAVDVQLLRMEDAGAFVVVAVLAWMGRRRSVESRRFEATQHRDEAQERAQRAAVPDPVGSDRRCVSHLDLGRP